MRHLRSRARPTEGGPVSGVAWGFTEGISHVAEIGETARTVARLQRKYADAHVPSLTRDEWLNLCVVANAELRTIKKTVSNAVQPAALKAQTK